MSVVDSYTSLQTAIGDWLARSDLTGFIPNFIQNFESDFLREPKNFGRWMESELNITIASSVATVPTDYLELKFAYVDGQPSSRLDRASVNQCLGRYPRGSSTGFPVLISRLAGNFIFGPEPDSDYTIKGVYYAKPTLLRNFAADAAAHWLIVNAPDLLVYGSLIHSAPFLRNDSRLPIWQSLYGQYLQSYRNLIEDEEESGSPVQEFLG